MPAAGPPTAPPRPVAPSWDVGEAARRRPRPRRHLLAALGLALLVGVPLAFLVMFFVWPVLTIVGRGLLTDGAVDLTGFAEVFSRPRTLRIVGLTLGQAALGTLGAVLLGVPGAYVLYRTTFPGRNIVRALVTVPFVLPTVVVGVAFRSLLAPGGALGFLELDGTLIAIVLALVFFNYSVVVRTVGSMWAHLDERPSQAARALGAPPWRAFVSVTLPALTPAITSAAAVVFLYCSAAFGIVLVLGGRQLGTIETEIFIQTTQFLDLRSAAVLSIAQLVVITAVLRLAAAARESRERALRLAADSEGAPGGGRPLGRADLPLALFTALVILGLLATPMASLLVRSFQTATGWGLENYRNLAGRGSANTLSVSVWDALENSLRIAVDATVLAVVMGAAVSIVLSRRPKKLLGRRTIRAFDTLFMLPLGVSAVTVGFGFLITLNRSPLDLRSSLVLVPIAQSIVAIPLVVRTVLPVLRAIDDRQREAAAILGASPVRVFWSVDAPILGRSLGLAVGFAFAISLGEFGATSFLARPERPTLPIVIFRLIGRPGAENLGMAMAASVVLALVTAGLMALAERLRVTSASEL